MNTLRRFTFGVAALAFTFAIGTLWVREWWPCAAFGVLMLGAACAWFVAAAFKPEIDLSVWLIIPFAVAFIGGLQLACGRSEYSSETWRSVLEWSIHGCAAFVAFQICTECRLRAIALRSFAVAAGVLALLATVQNHSSPGRVFWLFDSGYADTVFGPFTYHTKLAAFAELTIPVALWLALTERELRSLYATAAIALAGAVVASGSRGGLGVLTLEIAVLSIVVARRHWHGNLLRTLGVFGAAMAAGVVVCGWELMQRRLAAQDPMNDWRLPLASTSLDMAGRYWASGSGLGTWPAVYPEFARFDAHTFINQAHCDWLQWLVEGGVALPCCMLLMVLVAVRSAGREWWTLGVVFVFLHAAVDYPMQQTPALTSLIMAVWGASVCLIRGVATVPSGSMPIMLSTSFSARRSGGGE